MDSDSIVEIDGLHVSFRLRGERVHALRGVTLDVKRGESLAIVGESGSGKSVLCKCLMGLLDSNGEITEGTITFDGIELTKIKDEKQWLNIRGSGIAFVMQDPISSLNPLMRVGDQVKEAVLLHQGLSGSEARQAAVNALSDVGIDSAEKRYMQYPHEFSGGMRQRAVIAIALACKPKLIICDEPTTALDVTIQAQILGLIKEMQKKMHLTTIYVTHDLGVVAMIADRVAVMYAGDIIEVGTVREVFKRPAHPYTWALLSSLPQLAPKSGELYSIGGSPPNMANEISGDAFAPRNPYALNIDFVQRPGYYSLSPTHKARTWLLDSRAPRVDPPEGIQKIRRGDGL
ncbi:MAG: ABC transporter ATP-binding protein [Eubacteriaceae bacterium]|nr:ABC transporter ATP-binding protein [Eubacteriaceae bacterium]